MISIPKNCGMARGMSCAGVCADTDRRRRRLPPETEVDADV